MSFTIDNFNYPITLYRKGSDSKVYVWTCTYDNENNILVTYWNTYEKYRKRDFNIIEKRNIYNIENDRFYKKMLTETVTKVNRKINMEGYSLDKIEDETLGTIDIKCMLAYKFQPRSQQIKEYPVAVQPKIDGVRCLSYESSNNLIILKSRSQKNFCYMDHIRNDVLNFINVYKQFALINNCVSYIKIDGELYSDVVSFQEVCGIVNTVKSTSAIKKDFNVIKYCIFDFISQDDYFYQQRYNILFNVYNYYRQVYGDNTSITLVNSYLANNVKDIIAAHDNFVKYGYEGVMIKRLNRPYKGMRSDNMYKYKIVKDDEGIVIDFKCASSGDVEGGIIYVLKTRTGKIFSCNPTGSYTDRISSYIEALNDPSTVIGKLYRYEYQDLTDDGIPRFPIGKCFIEDRREFTSGIITDINEDRKTCIIDNTYECSYYFQDTYSVGDEVTIIIEYNFVI